MEPGKNKVTSEGSENSISNMIDEARAINERGRRSTAGAKFMAELLEYITAESKRRGQAPPEPPATGEIVIQQTAGIRRANPRG